MGVIKSNLLVSPTLAQTSPHHTPSAFAATKLIADGRRTVMGGVEASASLRLSIRNSFRASHSAISSSDSLNYENDDQDFVDGLSSWNCIGSSHGWLGYINPHKLEFYLFKPSLINHPYYLPYIILPSIQFSSHNPNVVSKMVFSSSPSPVHRHNNTTTTTLCVLVVITLDRVEQSGPAAAFCRIGDPNWTTLANFPKESCSNNFQDITYYSKHKLFYVVTDSGEIYSWDLSNYDYSEMKQQQQNWCNFRYLTKPPPMRKEFEPGLLREELVKCKYYLVMDESSGGLMVIRLHISLNLYEFDRIEEDTKLLWMKPIGTRKEKVYQHCIERLDVDTLEWFPVKTLVDAALFIGRNNGIVVDVRQVPGLIMPGYIYLACNAGNCFQLTALQVTHGFFYNWDSLRALMTTEDGMMTSFPVWNFE